MMKINNKDEIKDEKTDLRIVKTHKLIRAAFIELLQEMDFEQIRVHHITERALVNRSTFYKYYSGKSDLAGKIIAELKKEYSQAIEERFKADNPSLFLEGFTNMIYQKRHLILALLKIKTRRHHLYQDIHAILKAGFTQQAIKSNNKKNELDWDYQGQMQATLTLETMIYFFKKDQPLPIKQIAKNWKEMIAIVTQGIE